MQLQHGYALRHPVAAVLPAAQAVLDAAESHDASGRVSKTGASGRPTLMPSPSTFSSKRGGSRLGACTFSKRPACTWGAAST